MLSVTGLRARAGSFELGPVDLTVSAGRVLVVLGPSGAGKSMLLDTIAGFRTARHGRVRLGDGDTSTDITALPPEQRRVGVVFQDAALFPHLSVRDNVAFAPRLHRKRDRAAELLELFGIGHLAKRSPRSLSGGERQRVALARALAAEPRALLLDEPLSALDQPVREELREVLRNTLRELAVPAVHVTHDRDEALGLATDLAVLADGTLRQVGAPEQLTREPADAVTARLLGWSEWGPAEAGGTVFYRPEEVLLDTRDEHPDALRIDTRVVAVLPTLPLARVLLGTTPPIAALVLHRDLPRVGAAVTVTLPGRSQRILLPVSAHE